MNNVIELNKTKRQSKDELNYYKATKFNLKEKVGTSFDFVYTYDLSDNKDYEFIDILNESSLYYIKPQRVWIDCEDNNDIIIINTSDKNEKYEFKNLLKGDKLMMVNDHFDLEYIECSNKYWDSNINFNQKWLKLIVGENWLKIYGKCKFQMQFNYPIFK